MYFHFLVALVSHHIHSSKSSGVSKGNNKESCNWNNPPLPPLSFFFWWFRHHVKSLWLHFPPHFNLSQPISIRQVGRGVSSVVLFFYRGGSPYWTSVLTCWNETSQNMFDYWRWGYFLVRTKSLPSRTQTRPINGWLFGALCLHISGA